MSRRRRQAAHGHPQQAVSLFGWWTIPRATSIGIVAGFAALMMAGLLSLSGGGLLYAYVALLILTAICGGSVLLITLLDMRTRGTSGRMRPIRGFDVAVGLALLLPSFYALSRAWPELLL